jgi:CheY-like chemotaxis protein
LSGTGVRVTAPPVPGLPAVRALVVDDNAINRKVLIHQLQALGLSCVSVDSAAEALAVLQDDSFDLLITGLHMPGMSGVELASRVREASTMPVVLLTARADMQYGEAASGSPFDAVLIKPVGIDALRNCLWRLLPAGALPLAEREAPEARGELLSSFDLSQLDVLAKHGVDLPAFTREWRQSVEDDLAEMEASLRRNDPGGVRERLHSLSGAVGVRRCARSEACARSRGHRVDGDHDADGSAPRGTRQTIGPSGQRARRRAIGAARTHIRSLLNENVDEKKARPGRAS